MSRRTLFLVVVGGLLLAPLLAPYDPTRTAPPDALQPPSAAHFMGTDVLGRDVWSRVLVGGQRTVLQALAATALATVAGVAAGAMSALSRGWISAPVLALNTALLAVPPLVWSLAILALLGSGPIPLVLALAVPLAALMAAVSRAAFREINGQPYVTSARMVGAGTLRVVILTILPNCQNLLGRYSAILFTYAILNGAGLAFLGFSQPGDPEWGVMLSEARLSFKASPWPALASGLAITALVWAAIALSRGHDEING